MCTTYRYLVFFLAALLCNARPVTPNNNLSTRFVETLIFGGHSRAVERLPEYGLSSTTYEIIHGFRSEPAILKVTNKKGDNGVVRKEIRHTKTVGLWLYSEMILNRYYLVMKDVRAGFNGGPPLERFSEWYWKGMYTDLMEDLIKLRRNVELSLIQFAVTKKLLYYDIQFRNIFVDATFTSIMPIDWSPHEEPYDGVVELESVSESRLRMFRRELTIILPKRLNVNQLAIHLAAQGRWLRPEDEVPSRTLGEDDAQYDLIQLIPMFQGRSSETFEIVGGYLGVAAILKVVKRHEDRHDQNIQDEFSYMRKVGLILDSEMSDEDFSFVVKDLRKGNFPNRGNPPLKPFHELYLQDKKMAVKGNLIKFRRSVKATLVMFAREHGLLYLRYDFTNIFTDRDFKIIIPVDWVPEGDGQMGVRRVNPWSKDQEIRQYEEALDEHLGVVFNIDRLEVELKRQGEKLRLMDSERRVETINGKKYDLVPVGVENLGAAFCATYKFSDGYQGKDAILKLMKDVVGPPAFEDLISNEIYRLKKNDEYLYDNREGQYWYIIAKDTQAEE